MAQDRLYIRCKVCKEEEALFRVASCVFEVCDLNLAERLNAFVKKHTLEPCLNLCDVFGKDFDGFELKSEWFSATEGKPPLPGTSQIGNVCPALNITIAGAQPSIAHQPELHPDNGTPLVKVDRSVDGYEYRQHICCECGCNYTVKVKL